ILGHMRSRAGQADVGGIDPERVHAVQDVDLLVDAGIPDGRRLQAVPQCLVIEHHERAATGRDDGIMVPGVNQRMRRNPHLTTRRRLWTISPGPGGGWRSAAACTETNPIARMAIAVKDAAHNPRVRAGRIQSSIRAYGPGPCSAPTAATM